MLELKLLFFMVVTSMIASISYCHVPLWEEKTAPQCTADGQEFCKSCSTAVYCIFAGGKLNEVTQTCTAPAVCNSVTKACDGSTTTVTGCGCDSAGAGITYQADPYNDHWYVTCVDGTPFYVDCGDLYFDGVNNCVVNPSNCDEPGVFPDEFDPNCAGYYICSSADSEPIFDSCSPSAEGTEYFDPTTNLCAPFPGSFTCTVTGAFGDPFDCRRYYICTGTELKTTGCCAVGETYSPEVANCVADDGSCTTRQCQAGQDYCV